MRLMPVCLIVILACAACAELAASRRSPSQGFRTIELAFSDGFESGDAWRSYQGADLFLGARDGAFLIDIPGRQYVWTQNDAAYGDVVLEADLQQLSADGSSAYGLACRLDAANSGRGYYFLISGDGYASIRWSNGRSLEGIAPAQPSAHVKRGGDRNRLRAVCIGSYLALWVNGRFVAEARDERASAGAVGLAGVVNAVGERLTLAVDNLEVWRAALDNRAP